MKTVDYEWNGQTLHLLLNGAALFDAYDKFGTDAELLDIITGSSKKSFLATCWLTYKLAEQGELARRVEGFDREKIPSALRLTALMTPMDVARARRAIGRAVRIGFEMEHVEEPEVVDLGLRELQKKTEPASRGRSIFRRLRSFLASLFRRGSD